MNDRDAATPKVVCLLLLIVGLACAATDPRMVEPGYWLEQVYETSLVVPNHVAVSPSGIIVVTEWSEGERVVRVHEDGSLSTYAQPSSGHHFGVIFDAANNLYVGDGPNNLWRVSPTGEVTLVAEDVFGSNLDIGPSGNVYALGGENARVQRITPAGDVSVYAEGFVGATELAVCPATEEIFVFDMLAGTIWRAVPGEAPVELATGLIHEVSSIAVAPDGTLYLAAMGHLYTVSRIDGTLTEVDWLKEICVGLGVGEMDFDSSGRLVSVGGSCIGRFDMDVETAEVLWHGYGHSHALGVAPGGGGIYVGGTSPLSTIPGSVVRLEPDGSVTPLVEGLLPEVCGFVVKTTDLGYVVSSSCELGVWTSIVHEVDMATGAKAEHAVLPTHGFNLTIDPATGFLWGLSFGEIWYFDASDVRHSLFPSSSGAESIAFTPDGTLYITGYTTDIMGSPVQGALYRVDDKYGADPSYVAIADVSTINMCCPLGNIAGGMDGNIYWVGHGDHYTPDNQRDMHMLRITPAGDVTLIGYQFPMDPFAITADPDSQDLYFTSGNGVYRVYQVPVTVVVFPDSGLEAATRDAIGKPTGDIYDWDLVGLTGLDAGGRGIVDLEGIQHCADLTELVLWNNEISDIGSLAGLDDLEKLWLDNNQIDDISALSGSSHLAWLFLGGNQLTNIGALSGLTNLTEIELQVNQITDIGPLAGLTNLTGLYLHENRIADIAPLVSNAGIASGDNVDVRWNYLSLVPGSQGMLDIQTLQARGVDVQYEPQHPPLVVVSFPDSGLEAAIRDAIEKPTGDIYESDLVGLTHLDAGGRSIVDLEGIQHCVDLAVLFLWNNEISGIGSLVGLDDLEKLWLDNNQISNITALSSLIHLTWLFLGGNAIFDIGTLSGLTNLTELELFRNQITNIGPLAGLTNLTGLYLHENRITDIAPLVSNTGIDDGDRVDIRWNQLSLIPGSQDMQNIDALLGRGVNLEYDPQLGGYNTPAIFLVDADGNILCDGVFYGAVFEAGGADIAEWVAVWEPVDPGDVLELDPDNPGQYRKARSPCSPYIAGVVSTQPGIVLGSPTTTPHSPLTTYSSQALLALTGIVPVKVTDEGGPIQPGDLLVTSSTPGHAMRWAGTDSCPCDLVGKALEPMTNEVGVILVLLTSH